MILRPTYIDAIIPFIDKPQIKIITGIRRSGKSVVLRLLKEELLQRGVQEEQIITINFESFAFIELTKAQNLYEFVKEKIKHSHKYYLLLDGYTVHKRLVRGQDYYLWYKIYKAGYRGYNLLEHLYKMRDDKEAIARRTFQVRWNGFIIKRHVMKDFKIP